MAKKTTKVPEDPEKNELITKIEGDLPYDKDRLIAETRFYLQRTAESIIEAGKRLLLLKEKEGYGEFTKIVTDDLGIPYVTAWRMMNAALKVVKFPALQSTLSKLDKVSNVYTLLEAPEEDLKQLEEQGVLAGKDEDELAVMSVKEMRELVNQLKTQTDRIIKDRVSSLDAENKALRQKVQLLEMQIPKPDDDSWASEALSNIEKSLIEFMNHLNYFCFSPEMVGKGKVAGSIKARVEGLYQTGYRAFLEFIDKWEDYTGHKVRK